MFLVSIRVGGFEVGVVGVVVTFGLELEVSGEAVVTLGLELEDFSVVVVV